MKKIAAIFLLTIYSLTTLGIGIKQFYCCGKLKSTNITLIQDTKATCDNTGSMQGCCKTTFKSLKVKGSHLTTANAVTFTKTFSELYFPIPSFEINIVASHQMVVAVTSNAPPPGSGVPIYILNCLYRI